MNVDQLAKLMSDVEALGDEVRAASRETLPFERVTHFNPSVSAAFVAPDTQPRDATWPNSGGDYYLEGIGWSVWASSSAAIFRCYDSGFGIGARTPSNYPGYAFNPLLSFAWNMRKNTSTSAYGIPSGTAGPYGLSHASLGNMERGMRLRFPSPWKVSMGEQLTFTIRPLGFQWRAFSASQAAWRFNVTIHMHGFRTGVR